MSISTLHHLESLLEQTVASMFIGGFNPWVMYVIPKYRAVLSRFLVEENLVNFFLHVPPMRIIYLTYLFVMLFLLKNRVEWTVLMFLLSITSAFGEGMTVFSKIAREMNDSCHSKHDSNLNDGNHTNIYPLESRHGRIQGQKHKPEIEQGDHDE